MEVGGLEMDMLGEEEDVEETEYTEGEEEDIVVKVVAAIVGTLCIKNQEIPMECQIILSTEF